MARITPKRKEFISDFAKRYYRYAKLNKDQLLLQIACELILELLGEQPPDAREG